MRSDLIILLVYCSNLNVMKARFYDSPCPRRALLLPAGAASRLVGRRRLPPSAPTHRAATVPEAAWIEIPVRFANTRRLSRDEARLEDEPGGGFSCRYHGELQIADARLPRELTLKSPASTLVKHDQSRGASERKGLTFSGMTVPLIAHIDRGFTGWHVTIRAIDFALRSLQGSAEPGTWNPEGTRFAPAPVLESLIFEIIIFPTRFWLTCRTASTPPTLRLATRRRSYGSLAAVENSAETDPVPTYPERVLTLPNICATCATSVSRLCARLAASEQARR